jgi:glycerol-3-phosphate acyltransferase PlsY
MTETSIWALYVLAAYLSGSIPFALLVGLLKGVDLREVGSRNIGASNAGRVLGKPYFVIVLVLDALKGFVPVLLVGMWIHRTGASGGAAHPAWQHLVQLSVALAAIMGHLLPIYLKFRGGRGVATSLGVVLAIWPYYTVSGILAFVLWGAVKKATGYISVASIAACAAFPVLLVAVVWLDGESLRAVLPLIGFALLVPILVVIRHIPNIRRLLAGEELRPDHSPERGGEPPQ